MLFRNGLCPTTHKESSLFGGHKVNDEKCTVVDSGSHYGVIEVKRSREKERTSERDGEALSEKKEVNEMFIIIEFILLAETLKNTVHGSTISIARR